MLREFIISDTRHRNAYEGFISLHRPTPWLFKTTDKNAAGNLTPTSSRTLCRASLSPPLAGRAGQCCEILLSLRRGSRVKQLPAAPSCLAGTAGGQQEGWGPHKVVLRLCCPNAEYFTRKVLILAGEKLDSVGEWPGSDRFEKPVAALFKF